jgi:CBS domain-containing protein
MKTLKQMLDEHPRAPLSVSPDDTVFSALELMAKHDIGAVLVMRDGQLAGIFSERDYARKIILLGKSSKETMVREIMTEKVLYALPERRRSTRPWPDDRQAHPPPAGARREQEA